MTGPASSNPIGNPRRARLTAAPGALLGLCLVLGGAAGACTSPLATRPADVIVATPDGSPVSGAVVRADPIDPHHPLNIADYFKGEPGTLGSWRTDATGHAAVTLLLDRPTAVSFTAAGHMPNSIVIDPTSPSPICPSPIRLTLTPLFGNPSNLR